MNRTIIHGKNGTKVYRTWSRILQRCNNPKNESWCRYGARGIRVCKEWSSFINFYKDMGDPPTDKHSIDRVDNNKGYNKNNCRWATKWEQDRNTRRTKKINHNGKSLVLVDWATALGIKESTLYARLYELKWSKERALSSRVQKRSPNKARTALEQVSKILTEQNEGDGK